MNCPMANKWWWWWWCYVNSYADQHDVTNCVTSASSSSSSSSSAAAAAAAASVTLRKPATEKLDVRPGSLYRRSNCFGFVVSSCSVIFTSLFCAFSHLYVTVCDRLRSSDSQTCVVRRAHNTYGDRCFATAGPRVWNSLPAELQSCDSLRQFKRCLKTFLFGSWDYGALWLSVK